MAQLSRALVCGYLLGCGTLRGTAGERLVFNTNSDLGAADSMVTLNDGGVLEMAFTSSGTEGLHNALGYPIGPDVARTILLTGTGGVIDLPAMGAGATGLVLTGTNVLQGDTGTTLTKKGLGQLFIVESQNFAGHLVIAGNGDRVELRSDGALSNVSSITIGQAGALVLDNQNALGTRLWTAAHANNRINDAAAITLNGGRIVYRVRNEASTVAENLGNVIIGPGQAEIRVEVNGQNGALSLANLQHSTGGGLLNITTANGTLGLTSGNNPRLLATTVSGSTPSAGLVGGWLVLNGNDFLGYGGSSGFLAATYADQGTGIFSPSASAITNLTATATLAPGDAAMSALRFSASEPSALQFDSAAQILNLSSGGLLSADQDQARAIGDTPDFGRLTVGGASPSLPQSLYLHVNQNVLTINARIVDHPTSGMATVRVVKGLDGTVQLNAGGNSYGGGTDVYRGTLIANGAGTLGTGRVQVQGFSLLDLRAPGAVSGNAVPLGQAVFTAREGAEILLSGSTAFTHANDRFSIAGGATFSITPENAGGLSRVSSFTGGGQVMLAPEAIVRAQGLAALPELGGPLFGNLGAAADLYFSPGTNSGLADASSLSIGAGTPWKGLSSGRTGAVWNAGTLLANGDFYLQGLDRDGGVATLLLGANTAGTYAIVNQSSQAISAWVKGQVALDEDSAVSLPGNLTFVVTNGALFQPNTSKSLGDPVLRPGSGIASVLVQAGGTLDPGNYVPAGFSPLTLPLESPLNGAVTVERGGRLLLNDASGLGSSPAVITMKSGSVLELGHATAFAGGHDGYINAGRLAFEPGVIVRLTAGNINRLQQAVLEIAPQVILELSAASLSLTNQTNPFVAGGPGNPSIAPEDLTLSAGMMLTTDGVSRTLVEGRGKVILKSGVVLAPATSSFLTIQDGIEIEDGAVIHIGSPASFIDGLPRRGTVSFSTTNGSILPSSGNFTFDMAPGAQIALSAMNTWPDHVGIALPLAVTAFPSPGSVESLPANGHSLLLSALNFTEIIGPLTGNGAVIANTIGTSLGAGWGATSDFTFNGVFKSTNGQNPSFEKYGPAKMTLTNLSDASGPNVEMRIWQGELAIAEGGAVAFDTVRVARGATLTLDNTASAANTRISGNLAGAGGTIRLVGNATAAVNANVNRLLTGAATGGSRTYLDIVSGGAPTVLSVGTLDLLTNSPRQTTWVIRSPAMANVPGAYNADGVYTPAAGNLLTGLFSATTTNFYSLRGVLTSGANITGAIGTPVVGVRGDYLGDASFAGAGTGFVTQDLVGTGRTGFRLLVDSEYSPTFAENAATGLNVRLSGNVTMSGDTRFSTLTLTPGTTLAIDGLTPLNSAASRLTLNTGGIYLQGGATSTITATGNNLLQTPLFGLWFHGPGDLNLDAAIFTDNNVVKSGSGTIHFGAGAARLWRGALVVDDGVVNLGPNNSFALTRGPVASTGAALGQSLSLNGGTLNLGGNSQLIGSLNSANPVPYEPGAGGTLHSSTPATVSVQTGGRFSGLITGAITLDKFANNDLILHNLASHTGPTSVRGGTLILRDEGRLSQTPQVDIAYGTLRLDSGSLAKYNDRVNPAAVLNLRGGTVQLDGRAGEVVTQTFASVNLLEGRNTFNVFAGSAGAGIFTFGDLQRAANSRATVSFGQNFGFVGAAGNHTTAIRYLLNQFNGAPVTLTNHLIAPWMVVNGDHFATYSATNGIGALGNIADGFAAYDSLDLSAAVSSQVVNDGNNRTLAVDRSLAALRLGATFTQTITIGSGVTLTVESGGLLTNSSQPVILGRDLASAP